MVNTTAHGLFTGFGYAVSVSGAGVEFSSTTLRDLDDCYSEVLDVVGDDQGEELFSSALDDLYTSFTASDTFEPSVEWAVSCHPLLKLV